MIIEFLMKTAWSLASWRNLRLNMDAQDTGAEVSRTTVVGAYPRTAGWRISERSKQFLRRETKVNAVQ